jgi:MFS family permease
MLTHRPLVVANLVGLALGVCLFVVFLGVSSLAETPKSLAGYGFTASVLSTSVVYLLPGSLSGIVAAPLGGLAIGRYGPRNTLVVGMTLAAAACLALALYHGHTWEVIVEVVAAMMAIVCGYAATPALLAQHVDVTETGLANSINSICRSVGSALASAMTVALLTRDTLPGLPVPVPRERQFTAAFAAAAAVALVTALVVALALPRARKADSTAVTGAAGGGVVAAGPAVADLQGRKQG